MFRSNRRGWMLGAMGCLIAALAGCADDAGNILDEDDGAPPSVVRTVPADGGSHPADAPLTVTFNKPVDETSARTGVVIIGVASDVTYDAGTFAATVVPRKTLEPGAAYTLIVQRVRDLNGVAMTNVLSVNFTAQ